MLILAFIRPNFKGIRSYDWNIEVIVIELFLSTSRNLNSAGLLIEQFKFVHKDDNFMIIIHHVISNIDIFCVIRRSSATFPSDIDFFMGLYI